MYESVRSGECPIGLIPQENSIHGVVIEAYDILRTPDVGREVFVRGEVTIGIQHCLITRQGVGLGDVKRVLSHEQVRTKFDLCVLPGVKLSKLFHSLMLHHAIHFPVSVKPPIHKTHPCLGGDVDLLPPVGRPYRELTWR